jgi:hypothetical protein
MDVFAKVRQICFKNTDLTKNSLDKKRLVNTDPSPEYSCSLVHLPFVWPASSKYSEKNVFFRDCNPRIHSPLSLFCK